MQTTQNIRRELINRINRLPKRKLEDIKTYINKIDATNNSEQTILSFAGAWNDLDDDTFDSLTKEIPTRRNQSIRK